MTALPLNEMLLLLAALTAAGLVGGLVAGLFGVGGGTVIVPAVFYAFEVLGVGGEGNLHTAIGTSLLTIVATSWRSLKAHRSHGAVDEVVLKTWTPWVAAGALIGAAVAGATSMTGLAIVYGVCLLVVAAQMGLLPERVTLRRDLPEGWGRRATGTVIGGLSAMMGIGGGSFGGMMMMLCGRPVHQAVATASGFGLAIGAAATLGFIVFGWDAGGRPPLSLGYVNVPGAIVMAVLTTAVAPWGARLAHALDRAVLRRAFALWLLATAGAVVWKAL
ncbi:MAG: sulfite exporter TauE/SafE family protein [Alphaproteobacteria bacterium]|nr:sulfite exporter TauE/SafE family protein [Alphaproteobacteria bacterium]MBU2041660.1 sulfite exporter TauE/SafE family protein [Alphaproteobacteria bacterium]MBU2124428.1 sulfite exporter TauE/SafE family protein [Alphaproteobacteria bacterium]MBU2208261.1 sulfite exporter TauE/SafE family protein [Alphaproteobacteria bacterium]MBU2289844.1 sulfite exporter TauE/SafE family protein [Alphaproteobacteria bacterium]